jgi:hypothetical protein
MTRIISTFVAVGWLMIVGATVAVAGQTGAKPTLVVIIPGWCSGDGRAIEPSGLNDIADTLQRRLSDNGSTNKAIMYKWASQNPNGPAVRDLAKRIRAEADAMGGDVNLVVVGHSRGGIVANDVLAEVAADKRFGYVEGVLLDPTAARPLGDRYPTRVPKGVDKLYNYTDGKAFPMDTVQGETESDKPIEGAKQVTVDDTDHTAIVDRYESDYSGRDFESYREENHLTWSSKPAPQSRETAQSPKTDQERYTAPFVKAGYDAYRWGNDVWSGDVSFDPKAGLEKTKGGVKHFGDTLEHGGKRILDQAGKGLNHSKDVAKSLARDPLTTTRNGIRYTGNQAAKWANSTGRKTGKLADHWRVEGSKWGKGVGDRASKWAERSTQKTNHWLKNSGDKLSYWAKNRKLPTIADAGLSTLAKKTGNAASVLAKSAGGKVSKEVKNAGGVVSKQSKYIGGKTSQAAKDASGKVSKTTKDIGGKMSQGTKKVTDKASKTAKNAGGKVSKEGKSLLSKASKGFKL